MFSVNSGLWGVLLFLAIVIGPIAWATYKRKKELAQESEKQ